MTTHPRSGLLPTPGRAARLGLGLGLGLDHG
jgi:hypothetical protein